MENREGFIDGIENNIPASHMAISVRSDNLVISLEIS